MVGTDSWGAHITHGIHGTWSHAHIGSKLVVVHVVAHIPTMSHHTSLSLVMSHSHSGIVESHSWELALISVHVSKLFVGIIVAHLSHLLRVVMGTMVLAVVYTETLMIHRPIATHSVRTHTVHRHVSKVISWLAVKSGGTTDFRVHFLVVAGYSSRHPISRAYWCTIRERAIHAIIR